MPRTARQIAWFGVDPESIRALEPYVVLLPAQTFVNVNTASREVLVAVIPGLDLATAERIIQARQRKPFENQADVIGQASALPPASFAFLSFGSSFFEVRGRLRLGDVVLEQLSLVQRKGTTVVVIQRERVASRETVGS
jgi:general secretion pathway protein K